MFPLAFIVLSVSEFIVVFVEKVEALLFCYVVFFTFKNIFHDVIWIL